MVLVDELDRCRPNYAIEMLEVIKHFFKTDNFVFVVATDTDQLVHSIAAVYGAGFDAAQYLKRFFDRKASLAEPDLVEYLSFKLQTQESYSHLNPFPVGFYTDLRTLKIEIIAKLANYYQLKIRDIDQLLNKLNSCLRFAEGVGAKKQQIQSICVPALIIGLIEFDRSESSFYKRKNNKPDDFSLIRNTDDEIVEGLKIKEFINLCMSSTQINIKEELNQYARTASLTEVRSYSSIVALRTGHLDVSRWANYMASDISNSYNSRGKYWLWNDYKKAIELAGNIE